MSQPRVVAALELGGTHVAGALVTVDGWRVAGPHVRRAVRADDSAAAILEVLLACAGDLAAPAGTDWGVALPGPFDYSAGIARYVGVGKFDALDGYDLGAALRAGIRPRPSRVTFVNDAAAFLLGEWAGGAAAGSDRAVGLTLGTGVGSAFLAGGAIVADDPAVPPGGEMFRTSYRGAPIEQTVSRRAVLSAYRQVVPDAPADVDVHDVARLALAGDARAATVFGTAYAALGEALGPYLRDFGAEVLVVGGSIARSWALVEPALRDGLDRVAGADAVRVVAAEHPVDAPLLGAALAANAGPH
jgi:glucokinase